MEQALTKDIKDYAEQLGADLVGIADLERVRGIDTIPENLLNAVTRAVVLAVQISPEIFEQIEEEPTLHYAHQYSVVNQLLDQMNIRIQNKLEKMGYKALAIPASQTVDKEKWMRHVSAKAVAKAAGLGWQGKSLLLITPQFGARVRIACLLTNAPVVADQTLANRCGNCTRCKDACPAKAIYGISWEDRPNSREEAIDLGKCISRLESIAQKQGRQDRICGVCIKVCPWGRQHKK